MLAVDGSSSGLGGNDGVAGEVVNNATQQITAIRITRNARRIQPNSRFPGSLFHGHLDMSPDAAEERLIISAFAVVLTSGYQE